MPYVLDGKQLTSILSKVTDVIAMGDTSSNQSIRMDFGKSTVTISAQNSAGTYSYEIICKPDAKPLVKRAIVAANVLLSYVKGREKVSITPNEDNLVVSSKGMKGNLFYLGSEYEVEIDKPTESLIPVNGTLGTFVNEALSRASDMKDRVSKGSLSSNVSVGKNGMFFSTGDSHHVVLMHVDKPSKKTYTMTMQTANMKRIFTTGATIAVLPTRVVSFSEAEYMSINASVDSDVPEITNIVELRDSLLKSNKKFTYNAADLLSAVTSMAASIEESTVLSLNANNNKLGLSVSTGAAKVTMSVSASSFPNKDALAKTVVTFNHFVDCLRTMKSKDVRLVFGDNMLGMHQEYNQGEAQATHFAAVAVIGG